MKKLNQKIRILQVCAIDETVKSLLLPLIDRLQRDGFDVVSCCSNGKTSEELKTCGYKIENVEIARSIAFRSNISSVLQLVRLMKHEGFDVVHVHTPVAALLARIAAKISGTPIVIYTAHGFYFHDRMSKIKYSIILNIEKFAGRLLTDFIFTQSEEDRQTAISEKIIRKDKICTISNGVDVTNKFNPKKINTEIIENKKSELNIKNNEKIILFVGRLVKEKGVFELIEAFNMIENKGYKLVLVGGLPDSERDKSSFDLLNELTERNDKIIMTGKRFDISDLLAMSDIFILPSYREGMPRSIIEAMAMGKPVIATNIRGCREEVVDKETGFLVEVKNPVQIKDRIIDILENPELESSMGQKARLRAEQFFDEEKVLDKELQEIKRLIGNYKKDLK